MDVEGLPDCAWLGIKDGISLLFIVGIIEEEGASLGTVVGLNVADGVVDTGILGDVDVDVEGNWLVYIDGLVDTEGLTDAC